MSSRPSVRAALDLRRRGGKAFVPFLTAGYPDWETCERAIALLAACGADAIELGVPFSDPLADGPTIQASSQRALEAGVSLEQILERMESAPERYPIPIVLMSYANPIVTFGVTRFCARAKQARVAGVLLSDLPPEELPDLWREVRDSGLETAVLVAPTTAPARIPSLAAAATGYLYLITRTGVTGRGGAFASNLATQVEWIRRSTDAPIIAGFGIRTPEDAVLLGSEMDGVIVGARIIEILSQPAESALTELESFARGVRAALDSSGQAAS